MFGWWEIMGKWTYKGKKKLVKIFELSKKKKIITVII